MKRLFVLFFMVLAIVPNMHHLFAWGQKGHRIIAQVAYDNLTNKTRKQVDAVLGKHGMIYLASWADEIKSDTIYPQSYDWHYQDLDGGLTDAQVVGMLTDYPEEGGNMFRVLDSLEVVLTHDGSNHDALAFYVHIYADRFCPMHTAHLDDQGGNKVKLKWFGQNTNLHSVWDSKLIENKGFSYTEYTNYLHNVYGADYKTISKLTEQETLLQTYHLTDAIYQYQNTWSGNAYHYAYHWSQAVEYQMYLAGVHLAKMLNSLL